MNPENICILALKWLAMGPIVIVRLGLNAVRWTDFWTTAYRHEIVCHNCGESISLVGIWRCRCGWQYKGHLLRACPICDTLPRMVRCYNCGITEKLPEP